MPDETITRRPPCGDWGFGSRVSGVGSRVSDFGSRVSDFWFRVAGLGFRFSGPGFGFLVSGSGFRGCGAVFGVYGAGLEVRVWNFGGWGSGGRRADSLTKCEIREVTGKTDLSRSGPVSGLAEA